MCRFRPPVPTDGSAKLSDGFSFSVEVLLKGGGAGANQALIVRVSPFEALGDEPSLESSTEQERESGEGAMPEPCVQVKVWRAG